LGIFLDLTKAFDVINHNLLLAKLELCGLRGKIHSWMSSYLTGRSQFLEIQYVNEKTLNLNTFSSSLKENKTWRTSRLSVGTPIVFIVYKRFASSSSRG
jgi:hypothetical protein